MATYKVVDADQLDGAMLATAGAIRDLNGESGAIPWDEDTGFELAIRGIVLVSDLDIYTPGNLNTSVIGGFTPDDIDETSTCLVFDELATFSTTKKIDLRPYNTFRIDMQNAGAKAKFGFNTSQSMGSQYIEVAANASRKEYTLDISSLDGDYYLVMYGAYNTKIYNMKLEA